jgi:hypothetical protein
MIQPWPHCRNFQRIVQKMANVDSFIWKFYKPAPCDSHTFYVGLNGLIVESVNIF